MAQTEISRSAGSLNWERSTSLEGCSDFQGAGVSSARRGELRRRRESANRMSEVTKRGRRHYHLFRIGGRSRVFLEVEGIPQS